MAPPHGLKRSGSTGKAREPHQGDGREGLVALDGVELVDGHPRPVEQALGGRHRCGQHDGGVVGGHRGMGEPGPHGQPQPLGHRTLDDQHGRGTVGHLGRVAGGDVRCRLGLPGLGRRQAARDSIEPFRRMPSSASSTPPVTVPSSPFIGTGHGLAGEVAVVPGRGRPPVALEGVLVHVLAADAPPVGQHLGHPELGPEPAVDPRRGTTAGTAPSHPGRWRPAGTRLIDLDPAGHHQVVVAGFRPRPPRSAWPAGTNRTGGRPSWPARCWGSPAATQALRVTLVLCSPTWVTQPPMTSSTCSGIDPGALHQRR